MSSSDSAAWPELRYPAWKDTCSTLQLWTQVVGKIRLARTPWLNHSWHVPLYLSARGLTTSPIPDGRELSEIEFDFVGHRSSSQSASGQTAPAAAAAALGCRFLWRDAARLPAQLGIHVSINELPANCRTRGTIQRVTAATGL